MPAKPTFTEFEKMGLKKAYSLLDDFASGEAEARRAQKDDHDRLVETQETLTAERLRHSEEMRVVNEQHAQAIAALQTDPRAEQRKREEWKREQRNKLRPKE